MLVDGNPTGGNNGSQDLPPARAATPPVPESRGRATHLEGGPILIIPPRTTCVLPRRKKTPPGLPEIVGGGTGGPSSSGARERRSRRCPSSTIYPRHDQDLPPRPRGHARGPGDEDSRPLRVLTPPTTGGKGRPAGSLDAEGARLHHMDGIYGMDTGPVFQKVWPTGPGSVYMRGAARRPE